MDYEMFYPLVFVLDFCSLVDHKLRERWVCIHIRTHA